MRRAVAWVLTASLCVAMVPVWLLLTGLYLSWPLLPYLAAALVVGWLVTR
jgi:hypothetical protein